MSILDHYTLEIKRFLDNCTQCGMCADVCPILRHTDICEKSFQDIQEGLYDFINSGIANTLAYTKAFACMECFKCEAGICPEDLHPMLINELVKEAYITNGWADSSFADTRQPDCAHRVMASIQVSSLDYHRIFTSSRKENARYLLFPGCNVYLQPEKILNALDILDAIGDDYAFLPGLDFCCGDNNWFYGDTKGGAARAEALVAAINGYQPEAVILWCPTCHCRFDHYISPSLDVPFNILSFPQYLAENMDTLSFTRAAAGTVTLHEACKSTYLGTDRHGPRQVLGQLPGVELIEMTHYGEETVCCGSGANCWFPQSGAQMRKNRLEDAARTGAQRLVTVCHYCNQTFASEEALYEFTVTNYVNLVAEAIGVHREDTLKHYMLWGDVDKILKNTRDYIANSPFPKKRIIEVLESLFSR